MNATPNTSRPTLPRGVTVLERGWLSSNNVLLHDAAQAVLIDSGYITHAEQTLALVDAVLQGRALDALWTTHLHSDHCGGHAALQARYPKLRTAIPPGQAAHVFHWNAAGLSFDVTGQRCAPFGYTELLQPGQTLDVAGLHWQVHAAPGHDPHSLMLFNAAHGILVSADALWENGFGVVFPELSGEPGFEECAGTLDEIERLAPRIVIPGHGAVFSDVSGALARARKRLDTFARHPERHLSYAIKVLIKFKLLEWQRCNKSDFEAWAVSTPYLQQISRTEGDVQALLAWVQPYLDEMQTSGALRWEGDWLIDQS